MPTEKRIYIVMGHTGEYSDHQEWPVRAFDDEAKAQRLVLKASAVARDAYTRMEQLKRNFLWYGRTEKERGIENPFDPGMIMDYTGTEYEIMEVALEEE